jgi:hypothetical protein
MIRIKMPLVRPDTLKNRNTMFGGLRRIVGWVEFFTRPNDPNRDRLGLAQGSTQPIDEGGSSLRAVRR